MTREDFFSSLKDIFLKHPKVTNSLFSLIDSRAIVLTGTAIAIQVSHLVAIEGAIVPILTFDYEEINIDLQIAILPRNTIPENLNILDDNILVGVDTATEKSLNGPRVTELMIKVRIYTDACLSVAVDCPSSHWLLLCSSHPIARALSACSVSCVAGPSAAVCTRTRWVTSVVSIGAFWSASSTNCTLRRHRPRCCCAFSWCFPTGSGRLRSRLVV